MGTLLTRLLALAVLFVAPGYAYAHVEINIDLTSQTMHVRSKPMFGQFHRAEEVMRRRGAYSGRARCT